jgi:hypothetical protein
LAHDAEGSPARLLLAANLRRFTEADLLAPPPRQDFILHPYVPAGTVTTLAGPGGSSKTTLLVYLAVCRALGRSFFGGPAPRRGRTAIVTTEDTADDYRRKLAALRHEMGDAFDAAAIADGVIIFDLAGVPVRLVEADRGNYYPTPVPDDLAAVISDQAPGTDLVIMETVSRLAGGIETNESLSILVEAAQRVCRLASAAVLLVAHTSQEAARQGFADAYAPRGGSALGDNGRSTVVLTRLTESNAKAFAPGADLPDDAKDRLLVLNHAKSNGAEPAKPLLLERASTPFGPVLRPAVLRSRAVDAGEQLDRLCHVVDDLAAKGLPPTERCLRAYCAEIGTAEKRLPRLLLDAVAAGRLRRGAKGGQGGGNPYEVVR